MTKKYTFGQSRNWDRIQFEKLRRIIDPKFNQVHDELSDSFYDKKPFRSYGVLTQENFNKLHGLIFLKRDVEFHEENLKQLEKDRIPEKEYNDIVDVNGQIIEKLHVKSAEKIVKLESEDIELGI